jgi:hypothetical protein
MYCIDLEAKQLVTLAPLTPFDLAMSRGWWSLLPCLPFAFDW